MASARPDHAQLRQIAAQLRPGTVLKLYQSVAEKVKRHVLIASSPERSIAFIINSRPSPFIAARPALMRCQVLMPQTEHRFMDHDSYIACHDTVCLAPAPELARLVWSGEAQILGVLDGRLHGSIAAAAASSMLIAERDMRLIVAAFAPSQ